MTLDEGIQGMRRQVTASRGGDRGVYKTHYEVGRLRENFYYRLCSDLFVTPLLAEQLRDSPDELSRLVLAIARRVARGGTRARGRAVDPPAPWGRTIRGRGASGSS